MPWRGCTWPGGQPFLQPFAMPGRQQEPRHAAWHGRSQDHELCQAHSSQLLTLPWAGLQRAPACSWQALFLKRLVTVLWEARGDARATLCSPVQLVLSFATFRTASLLLLVHLLRNGPLMQALTGSHACTATFQSKLSETQTHRASCVFPFAFRLRLPLAVHRSAPRQSRHRNHIGFHEARASRWAA